VDVYLSEQEQVEAIKKWWKDNGTAVIAGIAIGLLGVFGWKYWQNQQQALAENASAAYQNLLVLVDQGNQDAAGPKGQQVAQQYERSGYAVLATFTMARLAMEAGDSETAKRHLKWISDNATRPEFQGLARLRLSRIYLNEGDTESAWSLLGHESLEQPPKASYYELKGDIRIAQGKPEDARAEYLQALRLTESKQGDTALLQLKLDDLGQPVALEE